MLKTRQREPTADPRSAWERDWFFPAITCEGSVQASLRTVTDALEEKKEFIQCLSVNLCSYKGNSTDSISELIKRIRELETTLTFRLGMLSPERPGAWFRENMSRGSGPFSIQLLSEPILSPYEMTKLPQVRDQIKASFEKRSILAIPFEKSEPCIWLNLLALNQSWEEVDRLPAPFKYIRLSELPEKLPSSLHSPALEAFLKKVNESQTLARRELDLCFDKLWQASQSLWQLQEQQSRRDRKYAGAAKSDAKRKPPHRPVSMPPSDLKALRFMSLQSMPTQAQLKQRYRLLAQKFHPDRPGGCSETFKQLNIHYRHLAQRLSQTSP